MQARETWKWVLNPVDIYTPRVAVASLKNSTKRTKSKKQEDENSQNTPIDWLYLYLLVAAITASGEKEAVLDYLGRPVLIGQEYLIRVDYGRFIEDGWINHAGVPSTLQCPDYVSINHNIPDYVTFDSLTSSYLDVVRVSTEFSIEFPYVGAQECGNLIATHVGKPVLQ